MFEFYIFKDSVLNLFSGWYSLVACPRVLFIFWRLSCILSKLNGVRNELLFWLNVSFSWLYSAYTGCYCFAKMFEFYFILVFIDFVGKGCFGINLCWIIEIRMYFYFDIWMVFFLCPSWFPFAKDSCYFVDLFESNSALSFHSDQFWMLESVSAVSSKMICVVYESIPYFEHIVLYCLVGNFISFFHN